MKVLVSYWNILNDPGYKHGWTEGWQKAHVDPLFLPSYSAKINQETGTFQRDDSTNLTCILSRNNSEWCSYNNLHANRIICTSWITLNEIFVDGMTSRIRPSIVLEQYSEVEYTLGIDAPAHLYLWVGDILSHTLPRYIYTYRPGNMPYGQNIYFYRPICCYPHGPNI